jgi:hypothetical protein
MGCKYYSIYPMGAAFFLRFGSLKSAQKICTNLI